MDITILEDLGLTNAEIKTYLTLLELGKSHAKELILKSSLHTSVTHRALNTLIEKGLINYVFEGKHRIYQANDPKQFYNYIDEKKRKFDEIYPELIEKQKYSKEKEHASIYKGKKGISEVYNILVNNINAKEYLSFGGGKDCHNLMGDPWWKNIHRKRIVNNIKSRQVFDLTVKDAGDEINKMNLTNIKFLSKDFESFQETVICGDFVAITVFSENPYSFLIKDEKVALGYKKHFELLWEKARN